jgi:hypothetical protein
MFSGNFVELAVNTWKVYMAGRDRVVSIISCVVQLKSLRSCCQYILSFAPCL